MRPSIGIVNITNNIKQAQNLARETIRMYSSRSQEYLSDEKQEAFKKEFDPVIEEFESHKAMAHPLFDFLKEQSQEGFNSRQFEIYRANFFSRTELTIPAVARAVEVAARHGDYQSVADNVANLYDEGGYGDAEKVHGQLLINSHNQHGEKIFGLYPIEQFRDLKSSPLVIPELTEYRKAKLASFNKSYPYVAGNMCAHEFAADDMLKGFNEALFQPYKGYYNKEEWEELMTFFTAHADDTIEGGNVEERHGEMAKDGAKRACQFDVKNIPKMRQGGLDFLDVQSNLWNGLLREIENAKDKGIPVIPRQEMQLDIPSTRINLATDPVHKLARADKQIGL